MRLANDQQLDEAVYLWFVQKRSEVSGPLLCEKASKFTERLHGDSSYPVFKASNGWLWHFCKCHGICQFTLQGEKLSTDESQVDPFKGMLQDIVDITLSQISKQGFTTGCFLRKHLLQ